MRAIVVRRFGGPDVLRSSQVPDPRPGPGEVLVDIAASGVNFIDVYHRTGAYRRAVPFIPGMEAAGTVRELGPAVDGVQVGDRVAWVNVHGGYAERAAVPADRLIPIPDEISTDTAAAVLLQGMTAHYLVHDVHPVREGDTVLVHAAAGGVGLLLTQLARLRGGRVIGTVSTAEKELRARAAGADEIIRSGAADLPGAVRELTGGAGVQVAYDGIGAPTFDASLASLRPRGMLALFGQAGGAVPPVDLQRLNSAGSVFVTRPNLADYLASRAELLVRAGQVLRWVADGLLSVHVDQACALADAAVAHSHLEQRRSAGKLLLLAGSSPAPHPTLAYFQGEQRS